MNTTFWPSSQPPGSPSPEGLPLPALCALRCAPPANSASVPLLTHSLPHCKHQLRLPSSHQALQASLTLSLLCSPAFLLRKSGGQSWTSMCLWGLASLALSSYHSGHPVLKPDSSLALPPCITPQIHLVAQILLLLLFTQSANINKTSAASLSCGWPVLCLLPSRCGSSVPLPSSGKGQGLRLSSTRSTLLWLNSPLTTSGA